MRVSTLQVYTQGLQAFGTQQSKMAVLQKQISTGIRITKPSDDPAASSRILELNQSIELNLQYQVNINLATQRLSLEDTVLQNVGNALHRIKELAIQGNSGTQDITSRNAIADELDERYEQLISLSNTIDSNNDYLFAGYQSSSTPFTKNITGSISHVDFNGDEGERSTQISEARQLNVDTSGKEVFMRVESATALNELADPVNAGSGILAPAHVYDASVYVAGEYQIQFTTPTTYDVIDVAGVVGPPSGTGTPGQTISTGAYVDSENIDFEGIRTSITGTPAAGDVFTISPGRFQDIFSIVSTLSESLRSSANNNQLSANLAEAIQDIDNGSSTILDARTQIGGRLNALDAQRDDNEALIVVTQETIGTLRDTDLAEAISQLTLEQTTLDAAQAVFARITRSSLFNFLN